jgi:hypothetical protein
MNNSPSLEFWYDYKKQNNILRYLLLGTLGALVLCMFVILSMSQQKPFVIRVASNGETAVIDDSSPYAKADGEEAKYFTQEFLKLYLAPDSESVSKDLSLALSWMEPDLQIKHAQAYADQQFVSRIQEQKVRSQLYLNTLASSLEGEGYYVMAKGIVETFKKESQTSEKRNFEARLWLKSTSRSGYNPQGLLISQLDVVYREEPSYKGDSSVMEASDVVEYEE